MTGDLPAYLPLHRDGRLAARIEAAREKLRHCDLCPRRCGVDRLAGELGFCQTAEHAWVASYAPHFGEEQPLVGRNGSGTIFFTHCNLGCVFCQNYDISHRSAGAPVTAPQLAAMMLDLQRRGCHNINCVSPSHVVVPILEALALAADQGLDRPLVYNTGGYDAPETLALLDGIVDIYMPDFKFWDPTSARRYCDLADYPEVAREALAAMHRQVGNLVVDERGVARRGVILRHLVMPGGIEETRAILKHVATTLSPDTYVNLMPQYRPCGEAHQYNELNRRLTVAEFESAVLAAMEAGLRRLD
ncbi:MAG: radical SAM protein [Desulfobacterales bacterium]|nr:radical SAM protein [Desulfobacterales bacterium]